MDSKNTRLVVCRGGSQPARFPKKTGQVKNLPYTFNVPSENQMYKSYRRKSSHKSDSFQQLTRCHEQTM